MYDIAIIGLGPAGAALARLLKPGLSVIALDRKDPAHGDGFRKPCGGLLAPDAQKALARFGLALPSEVLSNPQIFSVRALDLPAKRSRHYQRFYINLDRHALDLWLKSLIPPHVETLDRTKCAGVEKCAGGYRFYWVKGGNEYSAQARHLVGSDGAASLVRRFLYPGEKRRSYLALQEWFSGDPGNPFYSCLFDPEITDCYAWGLSKGGSFILGGAFKDGEAMEKFALLKKKLASSGYQFKKADKTEACRVVRPGRLSEIRCGKDAVFLLGEAAGFISPSSLEGLSYAFDSARILAGILNRGAENPLLAYRLATLPIRAKLLGKICKAFFIYHPFFRKLIMGSGLGSLRMEREER